MHKRLIALLAALCVLSMLSGCTVWHYSESPKGGRDLWVATVLQEKDTEITFNDAGATATVTTQHTVISIITRCLIYMGIRKGV